MLPVACGLGVRNRRRQTPRESFVALHNNTAIIVCIAARGPTEMRQPSHATNTSQRCKPARCAVSAGLESGNREAKTGCGRLSSDRRDARNADCGRAYGCRDLRGQTRYRHVQSDRGIFIQHAVLDRTAVDVSVLNEVRHVEAGHADIGEGAIVQRHHLLVQGVAPVPPDQRFCDPRPCQCGHGLNGAKRAAVAVLGHVLSPAS